MLQGMIKLGLERYSSSQKALVILGAVVVSRDGLVIVGESGGDLDTVAAMTSVAMAAAETAVSEWGFGAISNITMNALQHKVAVVNAGPNALLVASVERRDMTELLPQLEKLGREIEQVLA